MSIYKKIQSNNEWFKSTLVKNICKNVSDVHRISHYWLLIKKILIRKLFRNVASSHLDEIYIWIIIPTVISTDNNKYFYRSHINLHHYQNFSLPFFSLFRKAYFLWFISSRKLIKMIKTNFSAKYANLLPYYLFTFHVWKYLYLIFSR